METQEAQLQPSRPPLDQEVVRLDTENLNKPVEPQDSVGPETDRKDSQDGHSRISGTALSMDDPDVRMAAQALGDLRADFIQSPPHQHKSPPPGFTNPSQLQSGSPMTSEQQEPLLLLLTTSHPLLSTAISGSLSAYSSSKSYSPRFRYGAEFVERHIGSPVASTVGSVGRRTGVEGGMRWWLKSRRTSNTQQGTAEGGSEVAVKRRKVSNGPREGFDIEQGLPRKYSNSTLPAYVERRPSEVSFADSLPAYDDYRSPNYEDEGALIPVPQRDGEAHSPTHSSWQSRLMVSTSGLGVAMSEESLRSLRYCLTWLRWANLHLGKVVVTLKDLVDQWDSSRGPSVLDPPRPIEVGESGFEGAPHSGASTSLIQRQHDQEGVAQKIQALKGEVLQTLKSVVDVVSTYAGGALPENARNLVRHYLTSLPQRFHLASAAKTEGDSLQPASETASSAQRVIVLAKEGLDMMTQVSGVLDSTIGSAEEWCDRLGRRKRGEAEEDGSYVDRKDGVVEEGDGQIKTEEKS